MDFILVCVYVYIRVPWYHTTYIWYLFLATSSKLFSSVSLSSFVSFFVLKRIRQKVFKFFTKRETRAKTRPPHTIRISFDGDPPVPAEARSGARFVFSLLSRIFFSLSLVGFGLRFGSINRAQNARCASSSISRAFKVLSQILSPRTFVLDPSHLPHTGCAKRARSLLSTQRHSSRMHRDCRRQRTKSTNSISIFRANERE